MVLWFDDSLTIRSKLRCVRSTSISVREYSIFVHTYLYTDRMVMNLVELKSFVLCFNFTFLSSLSRDFSNGNHLIVIPLQITQEIIQDAMRDHRPMRTSGVPRCRASSREVPLTLS